MYGGLLTLWLLASYLGYSSALRYIEPLGIVFALLSAVYTAFLFAQAKGRDFWQSPMLGLHMIIHALMAGLAVFLIASVYVSVNIGFMLVLTFLSVGTLVIHLITLAIELMTTHSTDDAHAVAKMITRGEFRGQFWLGMVLAGNVLPIVLLLTGGAFVYVVAGVLIMVGLYVGERIWVKAPQLIPLS